ncbi:MAG: N,N-dimethylformamidase beta subunit family domain-containing protein [Allorhizobium sp.]
MKRHVNHDAMGVIGYTTPWSVSCGKAVDLHLSCSETPTAVSLHRLDAEQHEFIDWPIVSLDDAPMHRSFSQGSYLRIKGSELQKAGGATGVRFELFLTLNHGTRTILEGRDIALSVAEGNLFLSCAGLAHNTEIELPSCVWLDLSLTITSDAVKLEVRSTDALSPLVFVRTIACRAHPFGAGDLLFGTDAGFAQRCLNARFAAVTVQTPSGIVGWQFPARLPDGPIASQEGSVKLLLHPVNLPTFCVTSARWDGSTFDPRVEPSHYDAIHCHDDDMGALGWPPSFRVIVPESALSGVYAFEIACTAGVERIVFFVASQHVRSPLVFVVPTATYLAYADESLPPHLYTWKCDDRGHRLAADNDFKSLYDFHSDLSGVSICSFEKPKATLREDYRYPLGDCPHNLPVDLHFLRFCNRNGIAIDLITDHDLHRRGIDGLKGYRAVVTGSHPEYLSVEMESAYRRFAAVGGSIAYLGGNGFAGTVAFKDDLMELRRSPLEAGRTWDGPIGEQMFAINNEPGGHLRSRGRGEFSLTGVAISLMGFDQGRPFSRTEESHCDDHAWLFADVKSDTFGLEGIVLGAAAAYEVDATDRRMGTSDDTVIVARATGFPDSFYHDPSRWYAGGEQEQTGRRCAEMTVRYLASGGLIFSASSVAWLGALPSAGELNDAGRMTLNLLGYISKDSREEKKSVEQPNNT